MTGTPDIVEILETVYRVEQGSDAWLRDVLETIAPSLDQGFGVSAYFVDVSAPGGFEAEGFQAVGAQAEEMPGRFAAWLRDAPLALKRNIHTFSPCGVGSRLPAGRFRRVDVERSNRSHRWPDMVGINALDASGRGCCLAAPCPPGWKPGAAMGDLTVWSRVAFHIAAGARIRRALESAKCRALDGAEAVLTPAGRLEHVEGEAHDKLAREELREAAVRITRVRSARVREPVEVTEAWQALVSRRWSLMDHFDHDGKCYLVARKNAPRVPDRPPLTQRELQVVGAAALGHANKHIAYELGITTSSVATYLARAARKLGVSTRVELILAVQQPARDLNPPSR